MGERQYKYQVLNTNNIHSINWNVLSPEKPELLFIPYKAEMRKLYDKVFKVSVLFTLYNSGIQTKCDEISVNRTMTYLDKMIEMFETSTVSQIKEKYPKKKDGRDWTFELAQKDVKNNVGIKTPYYYRPFDVEYITINEQVRDFA